MMHIAFQCCLEEFNTEAGYCTLFGNCGLELFRFRAQGLDLRLRVKIQGLGFKVWGAVCRAQG